MKLKRSSAVVAAGTLLAGGAAVVAISGSAVAAPPAYRVLTVSPATSGTTDLFPVYETNAACDPSATNLVVRIYGTGLPANGANLTGNSPLGNYSTTPSGGKGNIAGTTKLKTVFSNNGILSPSGNYTIKALCVNASATTIFSEFAGRITFTSVSSTDSSYTTSVANPGTEVTVAPISGTYEFGDSVTVSASVAAATGTVGAGKIQFKDNGSNLGAAQDVNASGTATFTTSGLSAGSHDITAVYVPGTAAFEASAESAPQTVVVGKKTTSVTVTSAGTSEQYSAATFTAQVSPASIAGSVQFKIDGTPAGTAAVNSSGVATFSTTSLTPGTYAVTADFTPTDTANVKSSSSAAASHAVTAYAGATTTQTLTTTVRAGELTISVDGDSKVALTDAVMDTEGEKLTSTGAIDPIVITDTRAGDPGWTASGVVSDFVKGSDKISAFNLGWTPGIVSLSSNQRGFVKGAQVAPALINAGQTSTTGLGLAKVLGTAADDAGNGTAKLSADLLLQIPTELPAGKYTATLTFTVL